MPPLALAAIAAFVPAVLWLAFFYRRDRLQPEPWYAVVIFFVLGAVVALPAAVILGFLIFPFLGGLDASGGGLLALFIANFFLAGLPEETIKGVLSAIRARREPEVDEPIDPMIYFTSLGLGFGAMETVLYIIGTYAEVLPSGGESVAFEAAFFAVAPIRALTVTAGHGLWTGIAGYFYSGRRFGFDRRWGLVGGIAIAAVIHAVYDAAVTLSLLFGIVALVVTGAWYGALIRSARANTPPAGLPPEPPAPEPPAASTEPPPVA